MLFTSPVFIFLFLPITLAMYYLLKGHRKTQNIVLLAVSIIFYAWGEPEFVILLILSIIFNWLSAIIVDRLKNTPPPGIHGFILYDSRKPGIIILL